MTDAPHKGARDHQVVQAVLQVVLVDALAQEALQLDLLMVVRQGDRHRPDVLVHIERFGGELPALTG